MTFDDVLKLHGVADDAVCADERRASDERAVSDLGLGTDDAGSAEISGGEYGRSLVNPDILRDLLIVVAESGAEGKDHILDALESLPGVGELQKVVLRKRMVKIIKVFDGVH